MTDANLVWNRACFGPAGKFPGDAALAAIIRFHSAVMNGGVLHAIESLNVREISDARAGFRFFDFAAIPDLIQEALRIAADAQLEVEESRLHQLYWDQIPDDSVIAQRFEQHFESHPTDFARVAGNPQSR